MFRKLLLAVFVIIIGLCVVAAFRSPDYQVERAVLIAAAPAQIFPSLVNPRLTNEWMPWQEQDPEMKMSYRGPEQGVGAVSAWQSTGPMGEGESEIIEVTPEQLVRVQIRYKEPSTFTQISDFTLAPEGTNSKVAWSVKGQVGFFPRLLETIGVLNFDRMIGDEFQKGLQKLKTRIEQPAIPPAAGPESR